MSDPLFTLLGDLYKARARARATALTLSGARRDLLTAAKHRGLIAACLVPREGSSTRKQKRYFLTPAGEAAAADYLGITEGLPHGR